MEEYMETEPKQELETWGDLDDRGNLEQVGAEEETTEVPDSAVTKMMHGEKEDPEEKLELTVPWLLDNGNEKETSNTELELKESLLQSLLGKKAETQPQMASLQRQTRGYFQNIDLGLQDNEILPPLKGYKAYNQQLAMATKKLKWQEEREKNPSQLNRNFMDDFDFIEEEEEVLPHEEEEARARAEQEEVRKQEAEAQEAREEEQRLADIASDMLLEYMGRKQKENSYMKDSNNVLLFNNVAEDKRSNEVVNSDDDDEMDPETIDKLIEISSKLHLPADDVVEIITDVEEKKKRKDAPPSNAPRFRPLVPLKAKQRAPVYQFPKSQKKFSNKINPYKKWYKEKNKGKYNKQDYWFKPQKQLLAYPSFPYYQKPYRAYYPVFFPPPKPRFYTNPAFSFDYNFGNSMGYGFKPPKRRNRDRSKGRDRNWPQGARQPQSLYPLSDTVISNYILPHPRTYQTLPVSKARAPSSAAAPGYFYHPDYSYDEPEPVPDSDDELENFIEKIYYNRRLF